jgi:hypothetical protein
VNIRHLTTTTGAVVLIAVVLAAQAPEPIDSATIAKIRDEGLNRSQVGAVFDQFVDVIGPRLAGSPAYNRAAEYARKTMEGWGLSDARMEPFEFGRGWTLEKFTLEMIEPRYMPLTGFPEAFTASTAGEIEVPVVSVAGQPYQAVAGMANRLRGAAVMTQGLLDNFIRADRVQPTEGPESAAAPPAEGRGRRGAAAGRQGGTRGGAPGQGGISATRRVVTDAERIATTLRSAPAAVELRASRGEHGTLFVQAGRREDPQNPVPRVVLIGEHYNMVMRLVQAGVPVRLRVNVLGRFHDDRNTYNVLAEIPGTDPSLRDEVVMLGAHLDSWHTGTGATDNADGSAAAMEAFRILKGIGVQPKRTLRLALWGAEEQGLLGSRAWVEKNLAGEANTAAREKLAVYFNIDPGKGPIYGWYLENNAAVRPIFDAWLAPFTDLGARRNVPQGIGSTDHLSFIRNGVIGFNPVQDYVGYDVREHHTQVDTAERISEADLKQAAVILASFVWHAAQRTERLPR